MIKSERYTSSKLNKEKLNKLIQIDEEVKNLKYVKKFNQLKSVENNF